MANKKITELDAITSASTDDILPIVDAPGGSAATKKITFDNLQKSITTIDTTKTGILKAASGVISAATAGTDYLAPGCYVDRGDPVAADFTDSGMTLNGAYQDMDLSSIIPTTTKAVLLSVKAQNNTVNKAMQFRKNGNSNSLSVSRFFIPAANGVFEGDFVVTADTGRIIEYSGDAGGTWSNVTVTVKGWWL